MPRESILQAKGRRHRHFLCLAQLLGLADSAEASDEAPNISYSGKRCCERQHWKPKNKYNRKSWRSERYQEQEMRTNWDQRGTIDENWQGCEEHQCS